MKLRGKAHKFGDNVNTDEIIPAQYLNTSDPAQLGAHCMEGIRSGFTASVRPGDLVIAGKNFGCGSSREHAPVAIKACGMSGVIAISFARIFYRNSINIGLPIFECPAAEEIAEGDEIEVDLTAGKIVDLTRKREYRIPPFPSFMQKIIHAGGLVKWVKSGTGKAERKARRK